MVRIFLHLIIFILKADEVITQNLKVVTKLQFIYSMLTNGEDPKDVLTRGEEDDDDENLEEMWNMDEEITDSSDGEEEINIWQAQL